MFASECTDLVITTAQIFQLLSVMFYVTKNTRYEIRYSKSHLPNRCACSQQFSNIQWSVYLYRLREALPSGRSLICMNNKDLPQQLQQILLSTMK